MVPKNPSDSGYELLEHRQAAIALLPEEIEGKRSSQNQTSGWQLGVLLMFILVSFVFLVNTVFLIVSVSKFGQQNGAGYLYEGNCSTTRNMSVGIHIIINVLSTCMLSGSNYCMQRLSAPSRANIVVAHAKRTWLDVGIPSVRNLWHIDRRSFCLWCLLGLSSVPLHLFYNSAVSQQVAIQRYSAYVVQENFLNGAPWSLGNSQDSQKYYGSGNVYPYGEEQYPSGEFNITTELTFLYAIRNDLAYLNNSACIQAYSSPLQTKQGSLLAVVASNATANAVLAVVTPNLINIDPVRWLCNKPDSIDDGVACDTNAQAKVPNTFTVGNFPISHCLSNSIKEQHCRIQYSVVILVIVITFNFVKMCCMLATFFEPSQTLVTIGDAMESFLQKPDSSTAGNCTASWKSFKEHDWKSPNLAQPFNANRYWWFQAPTLTRVLLCNLLCCLTIGIGAFLLQQGISGLQAQGVADTSFSSLVSLGLGKLDINSLVTGIASNGFVANALLSNLPQTILSFLFLCYNGMFTCFLVGQEWSHFAHRRRPLRVTMPKSGQKSTHWLGLPYPYAIFMLLVSATLHWLMSESLFLANLGFFFYNGQAVETVYRTGYSCIGIICGIIVGGMVVLVGILMGLRRYEPGMPLVRSSSAAIAAACHPSASEPGDMVCRPLKWGLVSTDDEGVSHCAFSAKEEIMLPQDGELCAGHGLLL